MPEKSSYLLVLTNLATILILLKILKPALVGRCANINIKCSYILIFLFCMFSFWGADWFGYFTEFNAQKEGWNTHLEEFYKILINNYVVDYLQFRFVIWGGALLFLYLTLKRFEVDKGIALYCFVACTLIWFSYARVSLAMACMMYGASFFVSKNKKLNLKTVIIGVSFLVLSVLFHKSAIFGAVVVAISYFAMNAKRFMKLGLLALPFMVLLVSGWLMSYMQMDAEADEGLMAQAMTSGQNYMSAKSNFSGIGTMIAHILEYLPKYMLAYLCFKYVNENTKMSPKMLFLINIFFYVMLTSSIFFFDLGYNTNTIYIRFQRFAIIPMFIVLAYFYEVRYKMQLTNMVLKLALIGALYTVTYAAYDAYFQS